MLVQGIYVKLYNYPAYLDVTSYDLKPIGDHLGLHTGSINYISSYLIGLITAIVVHEKRWIVSDKFYFFMFFPVLFLGSGLLLLTYAWPHNWKSREPSETEKLLYSSIQRTVTALSLSLFLFWNCNYQDKIRNILSNRFLAILGKFNYSIYMGHFFIVYLDNFSLKRPIEFSLWAIISKVSFVICSGIILGFLMHLFFEAPFIRLSRLMFTRRPIKTEPEQVQPKHLFELKGNNNQEVELDELVKFREKNNESPVQDAKSPIKFPTPPFIRDFRRKID